MKSRSGGICCFQVEMSRGGHPFSLQRKISAKTISGQLRDTKSAPGAPRNSYSVVLGFNAACESSFLEFVVAICGCVMGGEEVKRWEFYGMSERGIIISDTSDDLMRDRTAIAGQKIEYTKRAI